ncbi:MAG: SdpI family protein [Bacteroidota bacterium]
MQWLKEHKFTLILLILPFVVLPFIWGQIPDEIPIHWNLKGEPDGYGPKTMHLVIPFVNIGLAFLFRYIPNLDPKRNTALFQDTIDRFMNGTILMLLTLWGFMSALFIGYPVKIDAVVGVSVLLLMLFMGNFMGKVRPGYFIGLRTPWTLENETVWTKTHRLTGWIWVVGSLCMLFIRLFIGGAPFFWLLIGFISIGTLIPVAYSYVLFRKLQRDGEKNL